MQAVPIYGDLIIGKFIKEEKNRFICLVEVNGKETVCYIPASCRLSNFLNLEGRQVLLRPIKSEKARTKYSVFAVKSRRRFIPLNLSVANRAIEEQINRRIFSFLGKRNNVVRETSIEGYKADLFIHDTKTLIEIKSILSFEEEASFPSVYSERAVKQLRQIKELLIQGYRVYYMLVSLNSAVNQITLNQDMREFNEYFLECIDLGMRCCGYSICLQKGVPTVYSKINVQWLRPEGKIIEDIRL